VESIGPQPTAPSDDSPKALCTACGGIQNAIILRLSAPARIDVYYKGIDGLAEGLAVSRNDR
jgi:hypothetical protein